jgi:hypothetical protein
MGENPYATPKEQRPVAKRLETSANAISENKTGSNTPRKAGNLDGDLILWNLPG